MSDTKTCRTCGINGGWCEWADSIKRPSENGDTTIYCRFLKKEINADADACMSAIECMRQRKLVKMAETCIVELEEVLSDLTESLYCEVAKSLCCDTDWHTCGCEMCVYYSNTHRFIKKGET